MRQKIFHGKLGTLLLPSDPKTFSLPEIFCKRSSEGFLYEIFRHCETKSFRRKSLILSSPPLIHKIFCSWKLSETQHTRVPIQIFRHSETKSFRRKSLILSSPPLIHKIFCSWKLSETQQTRVPLQIFRHSGTKIFRRRILILRPPLLQTFFDTRN